MQESEQLNELNTWSAQISLTLLLKVKRCVPGVPIAKGGRIILFEYTVQEVTKIQSASRATFSYDHY